MPDKPSGWSNLWAALKYPPTGAVILVALAYFVFSGALLVMRVIA